MGGIRGRFANWFDGLNKVKFSGPQGFAGQNPGDRKQCEQRWIVHRCFDADPQLQGVIRRRVWQVVAMPGVFVAMVMLMEIQVNPRRQGLNHVELGGYVKSGVIEIEG